jgi:hypothetical protein
MRFQILFLILVIFIAGCHLEGFAGTKPAPFGIDKRPQPTGRNLEILLPKTVGPFTREDLPVDAEPRSDLDLNVEYKAGGETIFFGFSIPETEKDAFEAIKVTRQEAIDSKLSLKNEQYLIGKNPSYFKIADFMSWTRGKYFFYAKASSPQALQKFMTDFPY